MHRRHFPWTGLIAATMALLGPSRAFADVDMSGDWIYECDHSAELGDDGIFRSTTVTVTQTGGVLQWGSDWTGTVDPPTGVFSVEGPPGPALPLRDSVDGTVSADGNRMEGNCHGWQVVPFLIIATTSPMHGIRAGVAVCGDLHRDPGETCDHGIFNGVDACCSSDCLLVDPDGDGLCSDLDVCPDEYNFGQENVCAGIYPFEITKLILTAARHLPERDDSKVQFSAVLRGVGAATLAAIEDVKVTGTMGDDIALNGLVCVREKAQRLDCATADGSSTVKILSNAKGTRMKASLSQVGLTSTPIGPVDVTFLDQYGQLRWAHVTSWRSH